MQRMRMICVAGLFLVVLGLGGCAEIADENGKAGSAVGEDERFEAYTREVFCSEVSANAVSLHYTLKYPQEYGIESAPAVYGTVVTDEQAVKAGVENMEKALITFEKNKLSVENQITYDVLQSYLDSAERSAEYLWYDEPLGTVSGVQTQLPVVLSEYRFYEKEDADTYLDLMRSTGNYFDEVIAFERGKSEKGLFMSEKLADAVIEQCQAFLDMGNGNYLYSTFVERMRESGKYGSGKYGNAREHTKYTFLTQEIYATCKISYQKTFHNRNQNQRISYITLPPFKLYYYPPFSFPFSAFFGDGNTLQRP